MFNPDGKNFFQLFISNKGLDDMGPLLQNCVDHVKFWSVGHEHFLIGGEELRQIIQREMGLEVLQAFDMLTPFAYKADLGRLCLLYLYGGWYLDVSCKLARGLPDTAAITHVLFNAPQGPQHISWELQNSMIYARKGSRLLELAINIIIKNCKDKYYGRSALCPTGPGVLGRAFAIHGIDPSIENCQYFSLTPSYPKSNYAYVLNNGDILAWGKESFNHGLSAYGTTGTNSYALIYAARKVYGEEYN